MAGDNYNLVPSGGTDLTPVSPAAPTLSPADNNWVTPEPDFISEHYQSGSAPQWFGQQLPSGISAGQVQQVRGEITQLFARDTVWTSRDQPFVRAVVDWYQEMASAPVPRESVQHSYNLRGYSFPAEDQPIIVAFLNFADRIGADERQVKTALSWYAELMRRLVKAQPQQTQRTSAYTLDYLRETLSDEDWSRLERKFQQDHQKAEAELTRLWGWQTQNNIAIAQRFLDNMPKHERQHIANDILADGTAALNSSAVIQWLYENALGGVSGLSGGSLNQQIAEIEAVMKNDRKRYNDDLEMQAKLRHLYAARG